MTGRLTTRLEIGLSFAGAFALLAMVGGVAWVSARQISSHLDDVANGSLAETAALGDVNQGINRIAGISNTLMLRTTDLVVRAQIRQDVAELSAASARLDAGILAFEALGHDPGTLEAWESAKQKLARWRASVDALAGIAGQGPSLMAAGAAPGSPEVVAAEARAWAAWTQGRGLALESDAAVEALTLKIRTGAGIAVTAANRAAARGVAASAIAIGAGMIALILLALHSGRRLGRTIRGVVSEVGRVREAAVAGSLGVRGEPSHLDPEFRPIVHGLNQALDAYLEPISLMSRAVTRLSQGEFPERITERWRGDFDDIKDAVNRCVEAVRALVEDARSLSTAATQADFLKRADLARHRGRFRDVVQGVNETLDVVVQRMFWYEQILDAIPLPVMVMDRDLQIRFVNRPAEARLGKSRQALQGRPCQETGSPLCASGQCLARLLENGQQVTACRDGQSDLRVAGAHLKDAAGALTGHVEVTQDVTALVRLSEYQRAEIARISSNLVSLAAGMLVVEGEVGEGDEHTEEARGLFVAAAESMERLRAAIAALVEDVEALVGAAAAGKLTTRADPQRHQGEFRTAIEGINRTLDDIVAPVAQAASTLERLAGRDLRARVQGVFQGDHAVMTRAVNETAEALHGAMLQVAGATDQVSGAASQIASSSQAVATGASQQAAALQETTASVALIQENAQRTATDAARANQLAQTARTAALAGSTAVEQLQSAMDRIRASATSTSEIIRDVSEIAFQTNLLALNAAVEAARAGDAGRGFAVVAEEVRSLALRAKEAALKTEQLIQGSVRQVGDGTSAAAQVAGRLTEIAGTVQDVTEIVSQIAGTSSEQVDGIAQVSRAVTEMERLTQQNAASAEESSAAASSLSAQATELAVMVQGFQVGKGDGPAAESERPTGQAGLLGARATPATGGRAAKARS